MGGWAAYMSLAVCGVIAVYMVIAACKKQLAQNSSDIRRMQRQYVSQALAHAMGVVKPFEFSFVEPGRMQDLQPGCACWIATTVAYMRPEDSGSRVRWLCPDELNEHGARAEWQMCDMLMYRDSRGKYMALQFGGGVGLLTQMSGAFLPQPSAATHTLKIIDLGSVPDAPLRLQP